MELFAAGDESQMEAIKQWIDESDVFLLILGGRYGSIEPKSGKSYIHLEYEHALSKGKPLFACVIADTALQNASTKYDSSEKQLDEFRNFVKSKLVEFWEDPKDIQLAIHKKLGELARRKELVGWVRANQEANLPALSDELARLSRENSELRTELAARSEPTISGMRYSQLKKLLQGKGLWGFVTTRKDALRAGVDRTKEPDVERLAQLGLMRNLVNATNRFIPTEEGTKLLNQLDLEDLIESGSVS
jgi:acylphosphatase